MANPISKIRQDLYKMVGMLGDIQAIIEGPEAMFKRMMRKAKYKAIRKVIK